MNYNSIVVARNLGYILYHGQMKGKKKEKKEEEEEEEEEEENEL